MRGTAYLIGSMQGSTAGDMMESAIASALSRTGKTRAKVAVSYAAIAENLEALAFMSARLPKLFSHADVERIIVAGEPGGSPGDVARARGAIEEADLVFLSGGDPVVGARLLSASGADAWIRAARARGASCAGISAGAIMLGAWWARWPEEPLPDSRRAPFEGGELVPCTSAVPDLVVDCHDEDGGWAELKLVAAMLEAQAEVPRFLGIPSGGGLVVAPDGAVQVIGEEPFRL